MKTWIDLSTIELPPRVAALPRDTRGYPVPHTVQWDAKGVPDFRAIDMQKWQKAVRFRCCGLCGQVLGARLAFVGGPMSLANRLFVDLPMHRDCAIYAMRACPFLAAPKFAYSRALPQDTKVHEGVSTGRPERFGVGISKGFKVRALPGVDLVLQAEAFESITWWMHGRELEHAAC